MIFIPRNIYIYIYIYIYIHIYGENSQYIWQVEILAATKPTILNSAAGRANNMEVLMLVLDFVVISRLKITQWHCYGIHGMS